MQMQEKKVRGFSLLELLVVVTIIGIISSISFVPFMKWRGDRLVRTEALNVTSVIKDIFAQVQRVNIVLYNLRLKRMEILFPYLLMVWE